MRFKTKLKINLWKRYFDTGMNLTNYVKYMIAFTGLASRDVGLTLFIAVIYAIISFFLGWWWLNSDFYTAELEVSNIYNKFVREMRKRKV